MREAFNERSSIFPTRRYLFAAVVIISASHASSSAYGQAGNAQLPANPNPPAQSSSTAPTLTTPTMALVYERSFGADKGTIPIVSIAAAPKATIGINPGLPVVTGNELVDITLGSTFFGKTFTFNFPNIPPKDGKYTLDPTNDSLKTRFNEFYTEVQKTILEKLPVNADPRMPIAWNDPVTVTVTRVYTDIVPPSAQILQAQKDANTAKTDAEAASTALTAASQVADKNFDAATQSVKDAKTQAEKDAANLALTNALGVKTGIDKAKPIVEKNKTDATAKSKAADAAATAGPPKAYDPVSKPDARNLEKTPSTTTTTLIFSLQE